MAFFLTGLAVIGSGSLAALLLVRSPFTATRVSAAFITAGCVLGFIGAVRIVTGGGEETLRAAWSVPMGSFYISMDALSALFLVVVFSVSAFAAVFGVGYMRGANTRQVAVAWPMFGVLVGAMALVVVARNAVLFLVAWEAMALSSFFLVTLNDRSVEVRNAGRVYLIAAHIGTAFLLAFFLMMSADGGTLDFDNIGGGMAAGRAGALFVLALIGFGTKAGLMPMHVWLPEAHPAAPSHVSAVMSAVMIATGVYGLLRALSMLGSPEPWWGWTLISFGLLSGALGALLALSQHDLKRLLAYSTVENAGLIAVGIGIGVLGQAYGSTTLTALGYGGALLHVVNHALFKGLLFLGAGSVDHATGVRDINRLGGLLKAMPWTGTAVMIGAMAASGLPPLNGFISEFVLFRGGIDGGTGSKTVDAALAIATAGGLAVTGALAAGAMMKAFGIGFLGAPRSEQAHHAHEASFSMVAPMLALAGLAFAAAFASPLFIEPVSRASSIISGASVGALEASFRAATGGLGRTVLVFAVMVGVAAGLALLRLAFLSRRPAAKTVLTWDCGYARPTSHMQYTGSSFAEPVTTMFAAVLRQVKTVIKPEGQFPRRSAYESSTPDPARDIIYRPAATGVDRSLVRLRWLQHGRINLYILYIAVTLVALLVWKVGFA